jgi:hypothetical protein
MNADQAIAMLRAGDLTAAQREAIAGCIERLMDRQILGDPQAFEPFRGTPMAPDQVTAWGRIGVLHDTPT